MKLSLFFFLSLKASTEKLTIEEKAYSTLMQNFLIHYFCWSLHPLKKYSCIFLSLACFPVKRMSAFSLELQKNAKTRYWLLIMDHLVNVFTWLQLSASPLAMYLANCSPCRYTAFSSSKARVSNQTKKCFIRT